MEAASERQRKDRRHKEKDSITLHLYPSPLLYTSIPVYYSTPISQSITLHLYPSLSLYTTPLSTQTLIGPHHSLDLTTHWTPSLTGAHLVSREPEGRGKVAS
ncbi:unnamed protein product [Boreogadus saida]